MQPAVTRKISRALSRLTVAPKGEDTPMIGGPVFTRRSTPVPEKKKKRGISSRNLAYLTPSIKCRHFVIMKGSRVPVVFGVQSGVDSGGLFGSPPNPQNFCSPDSFHLLSPKPPRYITGDHFTNNQVVSLIRFCDNGPARPKERRRDCRGRAIGQSTYSIVTLYPDLLEN